VKVSAYLLIVRRFLFKRQGSALKSAVLAVALSLIPLTMAMEIADAMEEGILSRSLETATYHMQAEPLVTVTYADAEEEVERLLKSNPALTYGTVEADSIAVAFNALGRSGVLVRGMDPDFYVKDAGMARYLAITSGEADLSGETDALIGKQIAETLNLKVGDRLRLLSAYQSGGGYRPQVSTFTIRGIFSTGYQELDKTWVMIRIDTAYALFSELGLNTVIGLKTAHPFDNIEELRSEINREINYDWIVYDWKVLNASQLSGLRTTKTLLFFVLGLIVAVAVVNISGALYMFYLQNRQDVAALKALGASPAQLKKIFLTAAAAVGLLGSAFGLALGEFFALNINFIIKLIELVSSLSEGSVDFSFYLDSIPVRIHGPRLIAVAAAVTVLSLFSAYIPAGRAARSRPLAVLNKGV
jgi:lipoprotein-releasing system permease protein